jgi:ubiquinone/menaquinone biosynthesis C-methylase UbiE
MLGQRTDIFRNVEDAYTVRQAELVLTSKSTHLDVGSGSSLVPTFLYQRRGATTYATEMDLVYLKRQIEYQKMLHIPSGKGFEVQAEDATSLSFPDNSLDFISVISTIEHIPGDGDSLAMAEFERVLRPGGWLVVTVPASPQYQEAESTFYYLGFERRYDSAALRSRLGRTDLRLVDELHMVSPPEEFSSLVGEQFADVFHGDHPAEVWYKNGWHEQYPDVSILLTLALIRLSPNPEGTFGAMLTYEKP